MAKHKMAKTRIHLANGSHVAFKENMIRSRTFWAALQSNGYALTLQTALRCLSRDVGSRISQRPSSQVSDMATIYKFSQDHNQAIMHRGDWFKPCNEEKKK